MACVMAAGPASADMIVREPAAKTPQQRAAETKFSIGVEMVLLSPVYVLSHLSFWPPRLAKGVACGIGHAGAGLLNLVTGPFPTPEVYAPRTCGAVTTIW